MRNMVAGLVVALGTVSGAPDAASSKVIDITVAQTTKSADSLSVNDELLIRGLIGPSSAVANTITFRPKTGSLRLNASWVVGEAGTKFRLLGVNIDLLDNAGRLVASDTFQGLVAGTALSRLEITGLVPNALYKLKLTGATAARASYTMAVRVLAP